MPSTTRPALHRQPPPGARRDHRVVRDDDDGGAVGVDAIEEIGDLLAGRFVELAGRLVREQQRRPVGERAGDRDALHFAARQLRRPVIDPRPVRPTYSSSSRVRARRSLFDAPASACGSSTFSHAVSIGSRKKRWNTKPMRVRRMRLRSRSDSAPTSRPSNSSEPAVG